MLTHFPAAAACQRLGVTPSMALQVGGVWVEVGGITNLVRLSRMGIRPRVFHRPRTRARAHARTRLTVCAVLDSTVTVHDSAVTVLEGDPARVWLTLVVCAATQM